MAVAVKNSSETAASNLFDRLAVDSLKGALYVLASVGVVVHGVRYVWKSVLENRFGFDASSPVSIALMLVVALSVGLGLAVVGSRWVAAHPRPGLRSGIFFGLVGLLAAAWIASGIGLLLQTRDIAFSVGVPASVLVGVALLLGLGALFTNSRFEPWLVLVDEQGWFIWKPYKKSQGQMVRRGTILALLVLVGSGIYTLLIHQTLETGSKDWSIPIPFSSLPSIPIVPDVRYTLPLLLAAGGIWLSYRMVNVPIFADFLIATEAEMNKVSWTTRRRLVQDTIVVLVTVFLMTMFLFFVDMMWIHVLKSKWVGVLKLPAETDVMKDPSKEQPW